MNKLNLIILKKRFTNNSLYALISGEFNELIKFLQSMGSQVKFIDDVNQMGAIPVGNVQIGWFLVKTVEQCWQVGIVVHYRAETLLKWLAKQ